MEAKGVLSQSFTSPVPRMSGFDNVIFHDGVISSLNCKLLKLVDELTHHGSNNSATKNEVKGWHRENTCCY